MTTLAELLAVHRGLTEVHVERWVARGLLQPVGPLDAWQFESVDIARVRLLAELRDDLGLDDDTVAAVISLIDQVHTLRGQLDLLAQAIAEQPDATRAALAASLQRLTRA